MRLFKFMCFFILAGLIFGSQAYGQASWVDDFESYSSGSWPSTWTADANAKKSSSNYVDSSTSYQGNHSLRLFGSLGGCWAALAYRPLNVSPPFEIEVKIKNGDDSLYGCHPDRGGFGLRQGTYWSNPARTFIKFFNNGTIENSGGTVIGNYSTLNWYTVKVRYERPSSSTVKLNYWIDGVHKGEEVLQAKSNEDQITNVELVVQEGAVWFDEVKVSPVTQTIDFVDPYSADMQIFAGNSHSVGLKVDGSVVAAGYNNYGQCDVSSWSGIQQVDAGGVHTVGLKADGTVVAVGDNSEGQCNVDFWTDIKQVSAGWAHTVGLKNDGTVVAVGYCGNGKCDVDSWTDIVQVSAGSNHTAGLKSDGTVVAVGIDLFGSGTNVSSWTNVVQIATGVSHTVGLKADGSVLYSGSDADVINTLSSWSNIVQVTAGGIHTVGLKDDGTVVAAGNNTDGQCSVSSWTGIQQIEAEWYHTLGLKADGTVVAVGKNNYNQLDVSSWDLSSSSPVYTWYEDFDGDGYGNANASKSSTAQPYGYVTDNTDCDDSDPNINPGIPEIANDGIDQDCDGQDFMIASTVPFCSKPVTNGTNVVQSFTPAGKDVGEVGDFYVFTVGASAQFFGDNVLGMQGWNVDEVTFLADVYLSTISVSYDVNSMPKGTKIYIGYGVGSGDTAASMFSEATFVHAYTTVLDTKVGYIDLDQDGYGNPDGEIYSLNQPTGLFVSDNTDCDDEDDSVFPGATEIAGDGIDQDCDGADLKLSGPEEIFLLSPSPSDSETIGYGSSGGKVTFSFSKVADAAKYILHFNLHDILADASIPIPVELIPPGSSDPWGGGGGATPGFSEQFVGMVFELYLDSATWDVLALYDIEWGVEAYDSGGDLIGSTFSGSSAAKYVNSLKFMASNAIVMTSPVIGADLVKTDSAPVFKWDIYQGVSTYLVVLAHVGTLGFDVVIAEDNLTLNLFAMSDATWQSMPAGQWYWAVAGYDSFGNYNPSGFTIFDFEVSQ